MDMSEGNSGSFSQMYLINRKEHEHEHSKHKYQDSITGAHFEYFNMCLRLKQIEIERGIEVVGSAEELALCETKLIRDPFFEFAQKVHGMLKGQRCSEKVEIPEEQTTRLDSRQLKWDTSLGMKGIPRLKSAAHPYLEELVSTNSQQGSRKKLYDNYKILHRM
eukprot:TRINITY_DN17147_c0_g1_i1.p1 TRINITY_DN17147_c0_g1~~TRINITY_DN17147_c0_g1_i1.p1  ORF type:complete len:163 (+),score=24.27 TRINITY_DN17147_c0_g1_i1:90-578(+)